MFYFLILEVAKSTQTHLSTHLSKTQTHPIILLWMMEVLNEILGSERKPCVIQWDLESNYVFNYSEINYN